MLMSMEQASSNQNNRSEKAAQALQTCYALTDQKQRLACYDKAAQRFVEPTYKGRLGMVTEPFNLKTPHRLRFRSYGVIFVLYLRDEKGRVLQNLHIGGGGEDEYVIKNPGTYSLKIHGSARWEVWLEPTKTTKPKT